MTTNFDRYLAEKLRDPAFAERLERGGKALDLALQIADLRVKKGLSQSALAKAAGTTQQVISRIESPGYRKHSRATLERVAKVLGASVEIRLVPLKSSPATKSRGVAAHAPAARRKATASGKPTRTGTTKS